MHKFPENQSHGREFLDRAMSVTFAHDLGGNLTFLSQEGERISGYSYEEACRMNIAEMLDPEIIGQFREQIMRDARERVGTVYEIELTAKDGRRVALEVSTRLVLRDGLIEIEGIAVPSVIRSQFSIGHALSLPGRRVLLQEMIPKDRLEQVDPSRS